MRAGKHRAGCLDLLLGVGTLFAVIVALALVVLS